MPTGVTPSVGLRLNVTRAARRRRDGQAVLFQASDVEADRLGDLALDFGNRVTGRDAAALSGAGVSRP